MKVELTKAAIEDWKRDGAQGIEMRKYIFAHEWETLCDLALKGLESTPTEALRREDAPGSAGNAGSHYDMEPVFKNLQDAPRVLRNTFTIQHEGKRSDVVFASFAACIERENNSLSSAPSPLARRQEKS